MISQGGPCDGPSETVMMFNAVVNAVQVVLIAWLANRAHKRDRKEKRLNGNGSNEQ